MWTTSSSEADPRSLSSKIPIPHRWGGIPLFVFLSFPLPTAVERKYGWTRWIDGQARILLDIGSVWNEEPVRKMAVTSPRGRLGIQQTTVILWRPCTRRLLYRVRARRSIVYSYHGWLWDRCGAHSSKVGQIGPMMPIRRGLGGWHSPRALSDGCNDGEGRDEGRDEDRDGIADESPASASPDRFPRVPSLRLPESINKWAAKSAIPTARLAKDKIPARVHELWIMLHDAYIEEFIRKYKRLAFGIVTSLSLLHIVLNVYVVPRLNLYQLPNISRALTKASGREVRVQKIDWIAPTGVTGLHPLGRIRGVSVGGGANEKSSGEIEIVDVCVNPLKSILHARLMLGVVCDGAELHVRQADNFSWFGFPDDTVPSSRFGSGGGGGSVKQRKNPPPRVRWGEQEVKDMELRRASMEHSDAKGKRYAHRRRLEAARRKVKVWSDDTTVLVCSLGGGRVTNGAAAPSAKEAAILKSSNEVVSNKAHLDMPMEMEDGGPEGEPSNHHADKRNIGGATSSGRGALDAFLEESTMSVDLSNLYRLTDIVVNSASQSEAMPPVGSDLALRRTASPIASLTSFREVMQDLRVHDAVASMTCIGDEIKNQDAFKSFSKMVEDPGMVKKKTLGSKALQQARNWTPLSSFEINKAKGVEDAPSLVHQEYDHMATESSDGGEQGERERETPDGMVSRLHEVIPGRQYNSANEAPSSIPASDKEITRSTLKFSAPKVVEKYTPAPPGILAERYSKNTILKSVLDALTELLIRRISLETLLLQQGTLYGYIYDEPLPRVFHNVVVKSSFGKDFNKLKIDISADPQKRSNDSYRWTMKSDTVPRQIRDCIGSDHYARMGSPETTDDDPSGGRLGVHIEADNVVHNDMATLGPVFPNMKIVVSGHNLHAPLIERIVELPMDIKTGRLDGHFAISSDDRDSWQFPKFNGRVAVHHADFHFWDSSDEIIDATMDLIFEGDRVYLHKAKGSYGAVPMKVTGDLDLNPLHGEYRVSASVPEVEVNALRASLGVRPTPFSVVGSVSGTMHVTGPLEKPVFSGHAHVVRPTDEMFSRCEASPALGTAMATKDAAGAYHLVPFRDAGTVFSLDTATNEMTLHAIHAELIDGGQLQGSGKMNVSPAAEFDPSALDIIVRGSDINQEAIAKRFIPDVILPMELDTGLSSGSFAMKGAHMSPVIDTSFNISNGTSGSVTFQRESTSVQIRSPQFEVLGSVYLQPPSYQDVKKAVTQSQASDLAKPNFTGGSMNLNLNGLDVIPLLSDDDSVRNLSKSAGEAVRLRVNGRVKLEGDVTKDAEGGPHFSGLLNLENVRLNQMKLYRDLKGTVDLTGQKVSAHGKGMRPDETLDIELDLKAMADSSEGGSIRFGDSYVNLRCGRIQGSGSVMEEGTLMDFRVANIKLDDLELASLRGELQEVSAAVNLNTQTGRGRASILAPKYTGLQGDSLSGGFRWEKDVFRLEKFVLQQQNSRYEVQGEYVLPSSFKLPSSAGELIGPVDGSDAPGNSGRWRLRLDAPFAEIQDLTPLGRLVQSVNNQFPADYERAKSAFMGALQSASVRLNDWNESLDVLLAPISPKKPSSTIGEHRHGYNHGYGSGHGEAGLHFPALQTCQGFWKGSIQAFGGGDGATSCDFDLRGQNWQWGAASLDSFIAKGSGHSEDGVQLQEFVLNAGDAKLLVRGSFLNDNQDATLLLTDFPVNTLRPIFQAVPALQHTAPAVSAHAPEPTASPLPLGIIAGTINRMSGPEQTDETSPISGQLFMSGSLRGSKDSPSGDVTVRVYDAVVGPTRLSNAQASAKLTEGKDMTFDVNIVPLDGQRSSGQIVASGKVPIQALESRAQGGSQAADTTTNHEQEREIDVSLNVQDGGMAVLTSLSPNVRWKQGIANLTATVAGTMERPVVRGEALISKALLDCPVLKYPLNLVSADIRCEDDVITVRGIDAYVGRKGRIRVRGTLPLRHGASHEPLTNSRLTFDLNQLEVKARNMYTGQVDALLTARDSVERPIIGGSMRFSRGSLFLNPQAQDDGGAPESFEDMTSMSQKPAESLGPSVSKVFTLLTKGDSGLTTQLESAMKSEMEAVEVIVEDASGSNAVLDGLAIQFGPDLRALYPLVMNFGVSGELVASGPAHPDTISVTGTVKLPSGDINLLAAQFELDREHENLILFGPAPGEQTAGRTPVGIDPMVDVSLNSGDLKVSITGKASEWSEHLMMQSIGQGSTGIDSEKLDNTEAAKLLESKLKAALLADNGQIALSKLAGNTMATFMPKIETQGSVGNTKWRLVSAPSVPGLLDPSSDSSTSSNVLDFLALGAEMEVTFGNRLQAAMVRKLRESDIMTKWTLNYKLNSKLRMQFDVSSVSPYAKTLTFQYSSSDDTT